MNPDVDQAIAWLTPWEGKEIQIVKEEEGDQDIVHLHLEQVDVGENKKNDPDGYVSPKALLLHGTGVVNEKDHQEHLPQDVFEIPITDQINVTRANQYILIQSERASYTISLYH
jgi:hypothetical protein